MGVHLHFAFLNFVVKINEKGVSKTLLMHPLSESQFYEKIMPLIFVITLFFENRILITRSDKAY